MIDELKAALVNALSVQAFAALVAIPGFGWFFGLPVVSTVTQYIIRRVVGWAVQETSVGLSLLWIQLDMQYDVKTAEDAKKKLQDMINNPVKYSETQQKEILENFDEKTINLIQLGIRRLS